MFNRCGLSDNTERSSIVTSLLLTGFLCAPAVHAQSRPTVFISDTHMGIGKREDGSWHPYEDFRWPNALRGFLRDVSSTHQGGADLVILGDVFEMWQFPDGFSCTSTDKELGCTPQEMERLIGLIIDQHKVEIDALSAFVVETNHSVTIVPGNHDAALLLPNVWSRFTGALPEGARQKFTLASNGHWRSQDRTIYAEHGHQIGKDVNAFDHWPRIQAAGSSHLIKSWGEQFVQKLFNGDEAKFEIIDNIGPESEGIKYKFYADGLAHTAKDVARLISFNLFETSRRQKSDILGTVDPAGNPVWDVAKAKSNGHRLVAAALPEEDAFRSLLEGDSEQSAQVRSELDTLLSTLDDVAVRQLCDQAAMNDETGFCLDPSLGYMSQKLFDSKEAVVADHVGKIAALPGSGAFRTYVYGHTHHYERPRDIEIAGGRQINVSNTGAFQRVVTKEKLTQLASSYDKKEVLTRIKLHDFPACYSFIEVVNGVPTMYWWFQREDSANGQRLVDGDTRCVSGSSEAAAQ